MYKLHFDGDVSAICNSIHAFLEEKNFTVFCDIDHQQNASRVGMEMPAARTIVFGNPLAGTRLLQKDIAVSFDLPLRIAAAETSEGTMVIYPERSDFEQDYNLKGQPVLQAVTEMFAELAARLTENSN